MLARASDVFNGFPLRQAVMPLPFPARHGLARVDG